MPLVFSEILTKPSISFIVTLSTFRKLPEFWIHAIKLFHRPVFIFGCDIIFRLSKGKYPVFQSYPDFDIKSLVLKRGSLRQKPGIHSWIAFGYFGEIMSQASVKRSLRKYLMSSNQKSMILRKKQNRECQSTRIFVIPSCSDTPVCGIVYRVSLRGTHY